MKTLEKIFQRSFIVCVCVWTRFEYRPFYKRRIRTFCDFVKVSRKPFVFTIECGCLRVRYENVWPQISSNDGEIKRGTRTRLLDGNS